MSKIAILVTGASGMLLPARLLAAVAGLASVERLHLVVSQGAAKVLRHECGGPERESATAILAAAEVRGNARERIVVHDDRALDAAISSGSYRLDATIVLPCSSGTLGAVANGTAKTLIQRACLVALKERWPLLLGFRETPLSLMHIENMRRVTYAGATVVPPMPAFYVGDGASLAESGLERFLDAYVLRVLDLAGLAATAASDLRWEGESR
ncbi:MAG: UbiX family flavin prenyltransferase [Acidobacteriota bacterium]|nr:UbiX family flavin prenyltransferase [Acidobacteriota bacterium]